MRRARIETKNHYQMESESHRRIVLLVNYFIVWGARITSAGESISHWRSNRIRDEHENDWREDSGFWVVQMYGNTQMLLNPQQHECNG